MVTNQYIFKISASIILTLLFYQNSLTQPAYDKLYKYQCVYRLSYQSDSLDINSRHNTDMLLLLNKDNSVFAAKNNLIFDTLSYYNHRNNIEPIESKAMLQNRDRKLRYYITKNGDNTITTIDWLKGMAFTPYKYSEFKSDFDWVLLNDTILINSVPCQKAECNFGNRRWIAWFAPSIPISDGPYKFCGLPGLILKISDTQNFWSFTLIEFKEQNFNYHYYSIDPLEFNSKKTTKIAFFKALRNSIDNALAIDKQNGVIFTKGEAPVKKMYLERSHKDNNWIELFQL